MPLGYVNFTNAFFRPIKRLKSIVRWFPERSANFYLVLSRKKNGTFCFIGGVAITIMRADVPGIRLPFNYNL